MSYFNGAHSFQISGGNFSIVHGSQNTYNQSFDSGAPLLPSAHPDQILPNGTQSNNNPFAPIAYIELPPIEPEEVAPNRDLTGQVTKIEDASIGGGGYADVYKGTWINPDDNIQITVAIKIIRVFGGAHDNNAIELTRRRINRESKVWSALKGKRNILPFLGVANDLGRSQALISPFYEDGDVASYLKKDPGADREHIVLDVANGLRLLHSVDVIHGDLKPTNVLINKRRAHLCDFGISKIIDSRGFTTYLPGTPPYMAPELFTDEGVLLTEEGYFTQEDILPTITKATDCYAFGLVALQIMTDIEPKSNRLGINVSRKMQAKLRPTRERYSREVLSDELWSIFESCCSLEPQERPSMDVVRTRLLDM